MDLHDEATPSFFRTVQASYDLVDSNSVLDCLDSIAEHVAKLPPLRASELWLHDYSNTEQGGNITLSYWTMDKEEVEAIQYLSTASDESQKSETKHTSGPDIGMVEGTRPSNLGSNTLPDLTNQVVSQVRELRPKEILDLSLTDIPGHGRPDTLLLRIYYRV